MISNFFTAIVYQPLYNGLVFLMTVLPFADAGIILILFTIIVKLILFPISQKSILTQLRMRKYGPELEAIKEKYKDDRQEQAKQTMLFYKEKSINPFSGFLALLIQLPIIICLYRIFYNGSLSSVDPHLLYSFVHAPAHISMIFLGLVDLTKKSLIFAILAAATQFIQAQLVTPPASAGTGFANDLAKSMTFQTKFILPIMIGFISYFVSGAVALYWVTSNTFSIFQELYVRRGFKAENK